ncbi:Aste57867_19007 [Aphanomyces stellatus]|uniref:Aste57867_19007 protein n=1 Tax=Aphanomyces stellatus TaxID=120398 RepID=A0A485LBR3_9STRA|nr:hypothetical protein As57867_018943 [Aphanomyces stellatus]VFT95732.1 Aste57867_19007 [Aphanomyces stellatus]
MSGAIPGALYWAAIAVAAVFVTYLVVQIAINICLFRLQKNLLTNIRIDMRTTATIRVHNVHFKIWGLLLKFFKAPSQENFISLVVPCVEVQLNQFKGSSGSATPAPPWPLASLVGLKSPSHPIWTKVLPRIHAAAFLARFVHLVNATVLNVGITWNDETQDELVAIKNGSLSVHLVFDPDSCDFVVTVHLCKSMPLTIHVRAANLHVEVQGVEVRISIPVSQHIADMRVPLPNNISIGGNLLRVVASTSVAATTRAVPPLSLPLAFDPTDLIGLMVLLPTTMSFTWKDARMDLHHRDTDPMTLQLTRLAITNHNDMTRVPAKHCVALEVAAASVALGANAPLVELDPLKCSVEITPRISSLALKLTCELKRAQMRLSDALEPWVALASTFPPPTPTPPPTCISSIEVHGKVMNLSVHILPRAVFEVTDPSVNCPPLELRVEDIYVSALPQDVLGVRSRAELRLSRTSVWVVHDSVARASISLDYLRMFFAPSASILNGSDEPAEIEMEGEWLEVQYSPLLLHAIGGVFHLVMFTARVPLTRVFAVPKPTAPDAELPPKRPFAAIFGRDHVYTNVKFEGVIKRIVAIFPFALANEPTTTASLVEQVNVDSFTIEADSTSPCFRIHMEHIKCMRSAKAKPYALVGHFAVEETPHGHTSVVDLYGQNVSLSWDAETQLRVTKVVQDVTTAVYKMLFQLFHSYTLHVAPPHSKFRSGGLNPPIDDRAAYDAMRAHVPHMISASGNKLHRLVVQHVKIAVPEHNVDVSVDEFGGDDLPELWKFSGIAVSWRESRLAAVSSVLVRRTLDHRLDYVFGDFEAMLRQRQRALKLVPQTLPVEGLCVALEGIHVTFPQQGLTKLVAMGEALATQVTVLVASLKDVLAVYWRPQHPLFYRYFLKLPDPTSPIVWIDVRQIEFELADDPMESWLDRMRPIWTAALADEEGRRQLVEESWNSMKLTNADMLANNDVFVAMTHARVEKNATAYVHAFKPQPCGGTSQPRVHVFVLHVQGEVHPVADEIRLIRKIKELDSATVALLQSDPRCVRPCFDLLVGLKLDLTVENVEVCVRQASNVPLVHVQHIAFAGDVVVAQPASTAAFQRTADTPVPNFKTVRTATSLVPIKFFYDMALHVTKPTLSYSPAMNPTLVELALDLEHCFPLLLPHLEVDATPYWDILRRLAHGKCMLVCHDTRVKLLTAHNDYLALHLATVTVDYTARHVDVRVSKLQVKIEPHGLGSVVEIPSAALTVAVDWGTTSSHYIYPMKFTYLDTDKQLQVYVHDLKTTPAEAASPHMRVVVQVAVGASTAITTEHAKKEPAASVLVYGSTVEWLLQFGQWYMEMFRLPSSTRQRKRRRATSRVRVDAILHHLTQVVVESIELHSGLDVVVYHSDKNQLGLRLGVRDAFASLALTKGLVHNLADCFHHHMLSVESVDWAVHDVMTRIHEVQMRVCTTKTGSRGDTFLNLQRTFVEMEPTMSVPEPMDKAHRVRAQLHAPDEAFVPEVPSAPTKSILEHFDIKDDEHLLKHPTKTHNDDAAPDEPRNSIRVDVTPPIGSGCLCYVLLQQQRVSITLETLEAIVDIVDEWMQFVKIHVPSLSAIPKSVIDEIESETAAAAAAAVAAATTTGDDAPATETSFTGPANLLEHMLQRDDMNLRLRISSTTDIKPVDVPLADDLGGSFQTVLRVKFVDLQVSIQDTTHKGTVLLAIPSGSVEPAVDVTSETMHVGMSISGIFFYTSSMDVDMTTRHWLKIKNPPRAYCDSSTMLWKPVVQASAIDCDVGITHDVPRVHHVDVRIPRVDVTFDLESKQIMVEHQKFASTSRQMQRHLEEPPTDVGVASLPALWHRRRNLRWKLALLQWHDACRVAMLAEADDERKHRKRLSFHVSPVSNAGFMSLLVELDQLSDELGHAFDAFKRQKQVHPTVELHFVLERASLLLKSPSFDILKVETHHVECCVAHYEDQSGTLSCKLKTLSAVNLMPQTPLPDLVLPAPKQDDVQFVDEGVIIRVDAEMAAPVGGITVVQHFEINVRPLQVCITYELIMQLYAFLSSPATQSLSIHKQEEKIRNQFLVYTKGKKPRASTASEDSTKEDDLNKDVVEMTERASTNMTFKHIRLGTVLVLLTYKSGKSAVTPQHLEEMRGFELKLHSLVYTDKTCTVSDLLLRVRRDILLDILSQVGRNFNNIGVFLKERLDISRWAGFDFPLKSLGMSSSVTPDSAPPSPVFSLELKPETHPMKKAKTRFGFLKNIRKKKTAEISEAEVPSLRPSLS